MWQCPYSSQTVHCVQLLCHNKNDINLSIPKFHLLASFLQTSPLVKHIFQHCLLLYGLIFLLLQFFCFFFLFSVTYIRITKSTPLVLEMSHLQKSQSSEMWHCHWASSPDNLMDHSAVTCSSKKSWTVWPWRWSHYETTGNAQWHSINIPEDLNLHQQCCESLRPHPWWHKTALED